MVDAAIIDQLRKAADALNNGDPDPLASMFADGAEWRGVSSGHLWWKHTPAWRGPDEAREVLAFGIERQGRGGVVQPEFTKIGDDRIIGSVRWGDELPERYVVLTIRDGKIADMQGCRSMREAERFARRT
jgi:ketosteroid isomerase-like protein